MSEAFITRRGGGGSADLNFRIVDSIDAPQSKSKNLIVYPYFHTTQTLNDLVFTDNGDGSVTVNGTASAMSHFRMSENTVDSGMLYLEPGTYTLSGCPAGGSSTASYMLQAWNAANNVKIADDTGSGVTFTLSETTTVRVAIVVQSGTTCSGLVFWPQLEKGSAATAYAKYKQVENTIWLQSENLKESDVENYDFSAVQPFFRSNNKNLFCYPYYHANGHTSAGITYTDNGDGTVTAKGTATGTSIFRVSYGWEPETNCIRLEPGTYTLSGCPAGGMDGSTYVVELYKVNPDGTGNQRFAIDTGDGVTFTLDKAQLVRCSLVVYNGATVSGLVFKPQLEKGSAATAFVKGDATGQVWVSVGTSSQIEFNALKKNGIQVYPISAKKYLDDAWVDKTAKSYQGGKWAEWCDVIPLTADYWTPDLVYGGTCEFRSGKAYLTKPYNAGYGTGVYLPTSKLWDLSTYSRLEILCSCTFEMSVCIDNNESGWDGGEIVSKTIPVSATEQAYTLDISSVSSGYIRINLLGNAKTDAGTGTVSAVRLYA